MNYQFVKSSEKKRIIEELNEKFGIHNLPYLLIESGKEKIRGYSGHLSKEEILDISKLTNIELIGLYMIKKEQDLRLTIDGIHLLQDQITKSIIQLNNEQFHDWLRGRDINIESEKGSFIIKHNSDFIGFGRSNGQKLFNYIPKDRRLKK